MTARLVEQSGPPVCLVAIEPVVEGVGMARFEQAMQGDSMGRNAIGDLEQTSRALAQVRSRIVVAGVDEFSTLLRCEVKGASIHSGLLSWRPMLPLPD